MYGRVTRRNLLYDAPKNSHHTMGWMGIHLYNQTQYLLNSNTVFCLSNPLWILYEDFMQMSQWKVDQLRSWIYRGLILHAFAQALFNSFEMSLDLVLQSKWLSSLVPCLFHIIDS